MLPCGTIADGGAFELPLQNAVELRLTPILAHRFSWRSAEVCLKLGVDRTWQANFKNVEIDPEIHSTERSGRLALMREHRTARLTADVLTARLIVRPLLPTACHFPDFTYAPSDKPLEKTAEIEIEP